MKLKVPHTLVLLLGIIILAQVASYIIPQGAFQTEDSNGHEVIIAGSYSPSDSAEYLPAWAFLTAIPKALSEARDIIFFIFIIAGALAIIRKTGAINSFLGTTIRRYGKRRRMMVFSTMLLFAFGSSTIGMAEEYIPFLTIIISMYALLRLDALAAVGTMVIGYGIGYGTATVNPFTLLIAQDVAGLSPTSGLWFRVLVFLPMFLIGWRHLNGYLSKTAPDKQENIQQDDMPASGESYINNDPMTASHKVILLALVGCFGLIIYGVSELSGWGWYLNEMMAVFLGLTILSVFVGKIDLGLAASEFINGVSELTGTALIIGFAKAVVLILEDGQILHTIIHASSVPIQFMGAELGAAGMFLFQSILNFFIPSGSGQAFVSMPIMAPLADLSGIGRQVAVLAYQFGDGFTNMIVPTNPVLMGILGIAGISYEKWFRFILPLMIKLWVAGSIVLIIAVLINYQ